MDFQRWKDNLESEVPYRWIKVCGSKQISSFKKVSFYYCNRSGRKRIIADNKRKRNIRSQGTSKIETICTSSITVTEESNKVFVEFYKTHYSHGVTIAHIPLSVVNKQNIAAQLLMGIPSEEILDKIRYNVDDGFKRTHLTTSKDIQNIAHAYSINDKAIRHQDGATSVKIWVREMLESPPEKNCILLFKEQHFFNETLCIKKEDFMLAIMTEVQANLFKKIGNDGIICMDSTHGTNPYEFNLITILTVDDFGQGLPVTFLISNREDYMQY